MSGDERSSVVSDFACAAVAAAILLGLVFIAVRLKVSVIKLLAGSGVCGLLLGMMGKFF